jgi:hypothetical protein
MKLFLVIWFCAFSVSMASELPNQENERDLVMKVRVETITETNVTTKVEQRENYYLVVKYKVLEICEGGNYSGEEIKVVHEDGKEQELKAGDELFIQVKKNQQYRKLADDFLKYADVIIPEEYLADFEFVGSKKSCLCKSADTTSFGQKKHNLITMKVKVLKVPEITFDEEHGPPEDEYSIVKYKVLKIYAGEYAEENIKVAHFGETTKDLRVGDEVCSQFEATTRFRETAKSAVEAFGIVIAEEDLADFLFIKSERCVD